MWIEIKKDIFESSDFEGLNFILQLITWQPKDSVPRYHLFVNHQEINSVDNYNQLSEIIQKNIEVEFDKAINAGITKGNYVISKKNRQSKTFNVEEAVVFLTQPVYLVLENSLNDRYFLETIFLCFGEKAENGKIKLIEFVKNNWIQFVNAGGYTNIENYVKGQMKSYEHFSAISGKEKYEYMQCFVMMDSDKEYHSQVLKKKEPIKERLEKQNIKVHILKKRAMENYMPDDLNYKDGFPKKKVEDKPVNKARIEQEIQIQNLYPKNEISDTNYTILDDGLKFPKFKNTFPALFQNTPFVYKQSLINREGGTVDDNEFLEILQKINDLL